MPQKLWRACATLVITSTKNVLEALGGHSALPQRRRPKAQDEARRDWISKGITGALLSPTQAHHEVLQLALLIWYLKEMGQAMGMDKSQQFEMFLCRITFEFLPCYIRALLAQVKMNLSSSIVGGKVPGALIFGPFPKTFSLHPSQQTAPHSCQSQKKTSELLPVCKTSAFTIWHSVGLGWQGIWLASQDLLNLIHCVSDLVEALPLTCSHVLYSTLWLFFFFCQFLFPRIRILGLTVLFLPVPPGPAFSHPLPQ